MTRRAEVERLAALAAKAGAQITDADWPQGELLTGTPVPLFINACTPGMVMALCRVYLAAVHSERELDPAYARNLLSAALVETKDSTAAHPNPEVDS